MPLTSEETKLKVTIEMTSDIINETGTMLAKFKRMEARLSEKMDASKDQEIANMEERLNANISNTINNSIKDALKTIHNSIGEAVQSNLVIHAHTMELQGIHHENLRLSRKVNQLNAEQAKMKKQLNKIEHKNLERSLIVRGIREEFKETEQMIHNKFHTILSKIMHGDTGEQKLTNAKQIVILSCKRLGRYARNKIRPIALELQHKQDIKFILENRFDLERGIYVDKEYPPDIERKRKTLLPILRDAKKLSDYEKQSHLEDDQIVLKGKPYTVETLNQLPEELNVFSVSSKTNDTVVGFFGEINPLSNFYPSPFVYDGVCYISSEQLIQANKAKVFGDMDTDNQILCCSTSWECKELSQTIRNMTESKWEEVAGELCHPGIRAKFQQNPFAMDTLMNRTEGKCIIECASDRLWGNGRSLGDPLCLDVDNWISQGILGQILDRTPLHRTSIYFGSSTGVIVADQLLSTNQLNPIRGSIGCDTAVHSPLSEYSSSNTEPNYN